MDGEDQKCGWKRGVRDGARVEMSGDQSLNGGNTLQTEVILIY